MNPHPPLIKQVQCDGDTETSSEMAVHHAGAMYQQQEVSFFNWDCTPHSSVFSAFSRAGQPWLLNQMVQPNR